MLKVRPPGMQAPPPIPGFEAPLPKATPSSAAGMAPVPSSAPKVGIHYPSQDPARLGATQGANKAKWSEMNLNEAD